MYMQKRRVMGGRAWVGMQAVRAGEAAVRRAAAGLAAVGWAAVAGGGKSGRRYGRTAMRAGGGKCGRW